MQLFESINLVFVPFLSRQFSDKRNKSLQVIDLHKVQGIPKIQLIGTTSNHQNGPFGGWDMEGPPQKAPTFRARIRFHGRIPFEAPGSGTAAMLSLRQFFEKCKK